MAEFFTKFDCLPIDHSHGNLCAWRGILDLYEITGNRTYLERAKAKWDAAMKGGFVWPLGGVGEHWYVFFHGDEGCSESDWLRFSLDLWRFTGQTRYLDVAERLLENQYATNQCPNGGYGMAHLDGDAAGPVAAIEKVEEWPVLLQFPWAAGAALPQGLPGRRLRARRDRQFPLRLHRAGQGGRAGVVGFGPQQARLRPRPHEHGDRVGAADKTAVARGTLWVRMPEWASGAKVVAASGDPVPAPAEGGYLRIERDFKAGDKLTVDFQNAARSSKAGGSRRCKSLRDKSRA